MTNNDDLAMKLKEAAESATKGSWRRTSTEFNGICVGPFSFTKEEVLARAVEKRDAIFISVANPANILTLLAERDADKKRIAELEARTVIVKLPEKSVGEACDFLSHVEVVSLNDLRNLCDSAGIKLEVGE